MVTSFTATAVCLRFNKNGSIEVLLEIKDEWRLAISTKENNTLISEGNWLTAWPVKKLEPGNGRT